jgi:hypothetical protein
MIRGNASRETGNPQLRRSRQRRGRFTIARFLCVCGLTVLSWFRGRGFEALLKVGDDVVNVLDTDGDADEILSEQY